MVELCHLADKEGPDREAVDGLSVEQVDQVLLDAGKHIHHRVRQLDAGIAHLHVQIGLVVLAFPVQFFALLSDLVDES